MAIKAAQLHQIIAIERSVKNKAKTDIDGIYHAIQKSDLFDGRVKKYDRTREETELIPDEKQLVQKIAEQELKKAAKSLTELFDITATRDYTNAVAKADVVIDGITIAKDTPVPFLLFLETKLTDLQTLIGKLPTLDPACDWVKDPNGHLFKQKEPTKTNRTAKVQKAITLAVATDKHAAQAQLITQDEVVGTYTLEKHSGAMEIPRKEVLLERAGKLLKAVKYARESANSTTANEVKIGDALFGYLLAASPA